jgi:hypothetical protein
MTADALQRIRGLSDRNNPLLRYASPTSMHRSVVFVLRSDRLARASVQRLMRRALLDLTQFQYAQRFHPTVEGARVQPVFATIGLRLRPLCCHAVA